MGCILIASYDILGSIFSRKFKIKYVWLTFGSFYLYGLIALYLNGFSNLRIALIGSFLIGVFDATVGLLIADKFGANISEEEKKHISITPLLTVQMGGLASIIGLIAIWLFS